KTTQTGESSEYWRPVAASFPVAGSHFRITIFAVSWLPTTSHLPSGATAKCRGLPPAQEILWIRVRWPFEGSTENAVILSSPRFDPYRKRPLGWTCTVAPSVGDLCSFGNDEITWKRVSVPFSPFQSMHSMMLPISAMEYAHFLLG